MRNIELNEMSTCETPIDAFDEIVVRPDEPILAGDVTNRLRPGIQPEDLEAAVRLLVGTTFSSDARYIGSDTLTPPTERLIRAVLSQADPKETILLFPGDGSMSLKRESLQKINLILYPRYYVPAVRRVLNGKVLGVSLNLNDDLKEELLSREITTVIVIDDCIATGATVNTIRAEVTKYRQLPPDFKAITWFCRRPTEVLGFSQIQAVFCYRSTEGWPALNCLSTLLREDEKSQRVLERFVKRFIRYPYGFYKQLRTIRELLIPED